jgi:hypothetical protein
MVRIDSDLRCNLDFVIVMNGWMVKGSNKRTCWAHDSYVGLPLVEMTSVPKSPVANLALCHLCTLQLY